MKINDKSLSDFACFGDGINKEGFLEKKGEVNHGYKRRWFSLKGNLLFYFEKPGDKQPLGVIIVENCSVEISDSARFSFCIRFPDLDSSGSSASSRTYILSAESEMEMEKWMKAISSSSYAYVEMVVKEFEKTLERLKSETEEFSSPNKKAESVKKDRFSKSKSMRVPTNKVLSDKEKHPKTLTPALDLSKRSKSSETLNRIQLSRSPQFKKKKKESDKEIPNQDDISQEDTEISTFETLHSTFGAAIWTKILT